MIDSAKEPSKPKQPKGGGSIGGGQHDGEQQRFADYAIIGNSFYQIKKSKIGDDYVDIEIPLCDFVCHITEEITQEDGLEDKAVLRIAAKRHDGFILPEADIPATKFYSSSANWVNEFFGTRLFVYPGATKKDHLRACVHRYSQLSGDIPRRHVYRYTGWKLINDQWHYLTGTGAITAEGLQDHLEVDLGAGHMGKYRLPAPLGADAIHAATQNIMDLLAICPNKGSSRFRGVVPICSI